MKPVLINDSPKATRKTPVTRQRIPAQVANLRKSIEHGRCERCPGYREARYRAFTEAMDMKVCASCAEEARRLGIFVEALEPEKKNMHRKA
jgi:NAD-dependent SIR2 family protein deacetylase